MEWEYAARGGYSQKNYKYAGSHNIKEVAWFEENSHYETKPVGLKMPNTLGIFDMSGNINEWCEETKLRNYKIINKDDIPSILKNPQRFSGGSWKGNITACDCAPLGRSSADNRIRNDFGFRLALS